MITSNYGEVEFPVLDRYALFFGGDFQSLETKTMVGWFEKLHSSR
jgi:hypothetical protein